MASRSDFHPDYWDPRSFDVGHSGLKTRVEGDDDPSFDMSYYRYQPGLREAAELSGYIWGQQYGRNPVDRSRQMRGEFHSAPDVRRAMAFQQEVLYNPNHPAWKDAQMYQKAAEPKPAPPPPTPPDLSPKKIDVSSAPKSLQGPQPVPQELTDAIERLSELEKLQEQLKIRQEDQQENIPWTAGSGGKAQGTAAGKALLIGSTRPRYGASAHFGRGGARLITKAINV